MLDTRPGFTTIDGEYAGGGVIPAGGEVRVPITGRAGVPGGAPAVIANVTVVAPRGPGHATVYPCGQRPHASTLNYTDGVTVANSAFAGLDPDGALCVFTHAEAHVLVDVTAFLPGADEWIPLTPARLLDTRPTGSTIDGQFQGLGRGTGFGVQVTGRGGVSGHIGETVGAVALNVTAIGNEAPGHVTVRPCGIRVGTSTVNFGPREAVANGTVIPLDAHGRVCIDTVGLPDVVIDVVAVDPTLANSTTRAEFEALVPARLLDSRPGMSTIDGGYIGGGASTAGGVTSVKVAGRGGVPENATAVLVNLTVVGADAAGHSTVFACSGEVPNASTSNVTAGDTTANTALVELSDAGEICIATRMSAYLVLDVLAAVYVNSAP